MNSCNFSSNLAEIGSDSHSVMMNTSHDHNGYQNGHNNINVNGNGGPEGSMARYGPNGVAAG